MAKKKAEQVGLRLDEDQLSRLRAVQEHIGHCSRGQAPALSEIVLSIIGFGNPQLVSEEERAYLRGELSALGSGEPQDGPDIILSQSGKRLGHSRR